MKPNGGQLARTFVAELGGGDSRSEYLARAKCTRCVPEWLGPTYRISTYLQSHPATPYPAALEAVRDLARADVLKHVDRRHDGRLSR